SVHGHPRSRPLDFPRLKNDVAVGEAHGASASPQIGHNVADVGVQAIGEWVVQQEERYRQELRVARVLNAITLQRPEVVGVSELSAKPFEKVPIALLGRFAKGRAHVTAQVLGYGIVVEESVVDVE